jgi:hypothetical protein
MDLITTTNSRGACTAARRIAPEDIAPGCYIAVLRENCEFIRGVFCDVPARLTVEQVATLPDEEDLAPMKVIAVCLPFVLVQKPDGKCRTLDVRAFTVAALDLRFARLAFRRLKVKEDSESKPARRKKSGRKKGKRGR